MSKFFRAEIAAVTGIYQEVRNIENFQGLMMNFGGMEQYKANILPPLDQKMGEVSQIQDSAVVADKRFGNLDISSIDNSQLTVSNPEKPYQREAAMIDQSRVMFTKGPS